MRALVDLAFAQAGATTKPEAADVSLALMHCGFAGAMGIVAESLTHAFLKPTTSGDWQDGWRRMEEANAARIAFEGTTPHTKFADRYVHFVAVSGGLELRVYDRTNKNVTEPTLRISADPKGGYKVQTLNAEGSPRRFETLESPLAAIEYAGGWMRGNFDTDTIAKAYDWAAKAVDNKQSVMPVVRSNWFGPFGQGLTA